jgi:hypothetical protein
MPRALRIPPEIPTPPPPPVPPVHTELPLVYVQPVWEYRHIVRRLPEQPALDEAELNTLGAEGWELVGVLSEPSALHFYFKRATR